MPLKHGWIWCLICVVSLVRVTVLLIFWIQTLTTFGLLLWLVSVVSFSLFSSLFLGIFAFHFLLSFPVSSFSRYCTRRDAFARFTNILVCFSYIYIYYHASYKKGPSVLHLLLTRTYFLSTDLLQISENANGKRQTLMNVFYSIKQKDSIPQHEVMFNEISQPNYHD